MELQPSASARAALASLAVLSCIAAAGDVSQSGIATVTLSVPYRTLLPREVVRFTVVLRNDSNENLRYITDPYEVAGKQVFMTAERRNSGVIKRLQGKSVPDCERVRTIEHEGNWDVVDREATGTLQPGQCVEWDGSRFDDRLFRIKLGKPKSMQAQVLIGPGQWVSSEPVPITVIEKDLFTSSHVVFESFYFFSFRGSPRMKRPIKIHRLGIDGKEYLFTAVCSRICEVPKGCVPEFASDPETGVVTVRFPGFDVPPVHYDYHQMRPVLKPAENASPAR